LSYLVGWLADNVGAVAVPTWRTFCRPGKLFIFLDSGFFFFSFFIPFLPPLWYGFVVVVVVTVAYRLSLGLGFFFVKKQKTEKCGLFPSRTIAINEEWR